MDNMTPVPAYSWAIGSYFLTVSIERERERERDLNQIGSKKLTCIRSCQLVINPGVLVVLVLLFPS